MAEATPTAGARFDADGGAIFRRASRVLGGDAAAARLTEELFVRFAVHAGVERMDDRARWAWIYRVVTAAGLRTVPDEILAARLGAGGAEVEGMDEATRVAAFLTRVDRLDADELAEVLAHPRQASAAPAGEHPSALALDREPDVHAAHMAACARCREEVAEGRRLTETFVGTWAPEARPRVAAAVGAERARRAGGLRWRRLLWMTGATIVVAGLALVVARPRKPERAETPYADPKGASRAKKSGLQIRVRRGEEVQNLDPFAALRAGDRLHFRVRGERPRYLELRVRGPEGEVRVWPAGAGTAGAVTPGQSLDRDYVVSGVSGRGSPDAGAPKGSAPPRLWIVALFADRPFALDQVPAPDVEIVPVRVDLE